MTDTTRESVERFGPYAVDGGCDAYGQMEEDDFGAWVRYDDYTALAAERDALKADLTALLGPPRHGERKDGPNGVSAWQLSWKDVRHARATLAQINDKGTDNDG